MPFKEEFDRSPIDVLADKYGGVGGARAYAFRSLLSLVITVQTTAKTLDELLIAESTVVADEDTGLAPDGSLQRFEGAISLHPAAQIEPGTVEFTSATHTVNDDGNGVLSAAGVAGEIDYDTGEWYFHTDVPEVAGANWVVDYTWRFRMPSDVNGLWFFPAGDIRATFSPEGVPVAADTGLLFTGSELHQIFGQSTLLKSAKLIAGANTEVSIELLV